MKVSISIAPDQPSYWGQVQVTFEIVEQESDTYCCVNEFLRSAINPATGEDLTEWPVFFSCDGNIIRPETQGIFWVTVQGSIFKNEREGQVGIGT